MPFAKGQRYAKHLWSSYYYLTLTLTLTSGAKSEEVPERSQDALSTQTSLTGSANLPLPAPSQDVLPTKDYAEAIRLSLLFYYAQRSGKLPADNPIPWRNNSALNDCVVGGFYDTGDHVKFGFPFAGAMTILLWGANRFKEGYVAAGQLDAMYDTAKWGLDYMVNAWELVIQIGDGTLDHNYWGRPEDMTMPRICIKIGPDRPGSDVAGETAAALTAGALLFKDKGDTAYSEKLLQTAESIYAFAKAHRGCFSDNPSETVNGGWIYSSSNDKDEMCEAGAWLYRATGNQQYLQDAKGEHEARVPGGYSWETQSDEYKTEVQNFVTSWKPGGDKIYSPSGFAWGNATSWGTARHVSNVAFAALMAAEDGITPGDNWKWAAEQINYLLGDNSHDGGCFSYEIGYGKYPLRPHHRAASCPDPPAPCGFDNLHTTSPSPHILYGGLVGGPIYNDGYNDTRDDYVHNEVALDYNAGFQSALAGLTQLVSLHQLPTTNNKCRCDEHWTGSHSPIIG